MLSQSKILNRLDKVSICNYMSSVNHVISTFLQQGDFPCKLTLSQQVCIVFFHDDLSFERE